MAKATKPAEKPADQEINTEAPDMVEVTITKFGDGMVSTGVHVAGEGDIYAKRGDKLFVTKSTAQSLEVRGLAETA